MIYRTVLIIQLCIVGCTITSIFSASELTPRDLYPPLLSPFFDVQCDTMRNNKLALHTLTNVLELAIKCSNPTFIAAIEMKRFFYKPSYMEKFILKEPVLLIDILNGEHTMYTSALRDNILKVLTYCRPSYIPRNPLVLLPEKKTFKIDNYLNQKILIRLHKDSDTITACVHCENLSIIVNTQEGITESFQHPITYYIYADIICGKKFWPLLICTEDNTIRSFTKDDQKNMLNESEPTHAEKALFNEEKKYRILIPHPNYYTRYSLPICMTLEPVVIDIKKNVYSFHDAQTNIFGSFDGKKVSLYDMHNLDAQTGVERLLLTSIIGYYNDYNQTGKENNTNSILQIAINTLIADQHKKQYFNRILSNINSKLPMESMQFFHRTTAFLLNSIKTNTIDYEYIDE